MTTEERRMQTVEELAEWLEAKASSHRRMSDDLGPDPTGGVLVAHQAESAKRLERAAALLRSQSAILSQCKAAGFIDDKGEVRRIPDNHLLSSRGELLQMVCISQAGRAAAPGKWWDGEPMHDIRVVMVPAAESAAAKERSPDGR